MYPQYWTSGIGGIFMRYSYEYKKMCVELYRQGKWVETPEGVKEKNFRNMIQIWARTEESCGVNHKRVQRIMNQLALFGKRPKEKYHSYKGDVGKVADNIINRDFSTEKPLQKWTTDVSQFNLPWGKCYISPILDMNTNPEVLNMLKVLSKTMDQINKQTTEQYDWQMRIQICCIKLFVWRERYRAIPHKPRQKTTKPLLL